MNCNLLDIVFVVDSTGSMGSFISDAKNKLLTLISSLIKDQDKNMHIGLVAYRDHPPQDTSFVTKAFPLSDNIMTITKNIKSLEPSGGGDAPEAVFDGLHEACNMRWRKYAKRIIILVGDENGHDKCACGYTKERIAAELENNNIILYAIPLAHMPVQQFDFICRMTGGMGIEHSYTNSIEQITKIINSEFANSAFDQQVLDLYILGKTENEIAQQLKTNLNDIMISVGRLRSRELINETETVEAA